MKVLSIRQPWASLIVLGVKRFEIRTWSTEYRGPLLIHASSSVPTSTLLGDLEMWGMLPLLARVQLDSLAALKALPRSAIIGRVSLDDILTAAQLRETATHDDAIMTGMPDAEQYYWKLGNPVLVDPVDGINGKLNLWSLDARNGKRVDRALAHARSATFRSTPRGRKPADWSAVEESDEETADRDAEPVLRPRPLLAAIIGKKPRARSEVLKALWDYVVANGLRDPRNERLIRADARLEALCGAQTIRLFDLPKHIIRNVDIVG